MKYAFDGFIVDTSTHELLCSDKPVSTEPKIFDLLVYLISERDRVVSKDDLVEAVWEGRFVSDAAISSAVSALRRVLQDDGKEQKYIRTIRGRGFRFVAPVAETNFYGCRPDGWSDTNRETKSTVRFEGSGKQPTFAVLPFGSAASSDDIRYLSEGIAEDIVDALSKFRWLSVISPRSSFLFSESDDQGLGYIAAELGAQYVVDGSIRQIGEKLQVVVRLNDASREKTEWSEKFEYSIHEIIQLQSELSGRIVAAIAPASLNAEMERARGRSAKDNETWLKVVRAHFFLRRLTPSDNTKAQQILRAALDDHYDLGIVSASLAVSLVYDALFGWNASRSTSVRDADKYARHAISRDPNDALAHMALGFSFHIHRAHEHAVQSLEAALGLNENLAEAHGYLAMTVAFVGDVKTSERHVKRARMLSPRDPMLTFWSNAVAMAAYVAEDFERALEWSRLSVAENPNYMGGLRVLAATLGILGQDEEAKRVVERLLQHDPSMSCTATTNQLPFRSVKDADLYARGLQLAGLPR